MKVKKTAKSLLPEKGGMSLAHWRGALAVLHEY